jgi:hypothetical protein
MLEKLDPAMWSFGGGTALSLVWLKHRVSYDFDFFIKDIQLIPYLSPRLIQEDYPGLEEYTEMPFWIKVVIQGIKVDFLYSKSLTEPGQTEKVVMGRKLYVDTPEEIALKKLLLQPELRPRDVYDMAVIVSNKRLKRVLGDEIIRVGIPLSKAVHFAHASSKMQSSEIYLEEVEQLRVPQRFGEIAMAAPLHVEAFFREVGKRIMEMEDGPR